MEGDENFQEKKKRIGDGHSFAGSSTSSLSDFESRPAHYSKDERYLGTTLNRYQLFQQLTRPSTGSSFGVKVCLVFVQKDIIRLEKLFTE